MISSILQGVVGEANNNTLVSQGLTQGVLMPVSFGSLLCLMLLYWGQAALFSYTKYSKLTTVLFSFSFISLTTLLILRWVDSGHFPLSNLYESLLFLSWNFLGIQLVAQLTLISAMPEPAFPAVRCAESDRPHQPPARSAETSLARARYASKSKAKFFEAKPDFALREVSQRQLLHLLGVITSPMALLTYGFAFLNLPREMQKATALVPALQSNWLMMHVTIMILSYAALLCGSIFSMVFLLLTSLNTSSPRLQTVSKPASGPELPKLCFSDGLKLHDWALRAQTRAGSASSRPPARFLAITKPKQNLDMGLLLARLGSLGNLSAQPTSSELPTATLEQTPYLSLAERLDNYSYRVLALGFPLLTVGILSGAVWANEAWGSYWSWDPKETWALITWLVFAIYLHARILKGWTGRKPAIIATFGFFVVWFCYLGVNLLGTGLHSYGWFSN